MDKQHAKDCLESKMDIKTWTVLKNSMCTTCLSRTKSLFLANEVDELPQLFPDLTFGQNYRICVECKAMAMKFVAFRNRAYKAQMVFKNIAKQVEINTQQSLSQLTPVKVEPDEISCGDLGIKVLGIPVKNNPIKLEETCASDKNEQQKTNPSCISDNATLSRDIILVDKTLVKEEISHVSVEFDINEDLNSGTDNQLLVEKDQPIRNMKTIKTGNTFYFLVPAQKVNTPEEKPSVSRVPVPPATHKNIGLPKVPLPSPTPEPSSVSVSNQKRPNFDTRTGKYHEELFQLITLTDSEMIDARQKKLNCATFKNNHRKCMSCIVSFATDSALEKHAVKHQDISGTFECKICQQRWFTQEELDEHIKSHYGCYECTMCKRTFLLRTRALEHYHNYHQFGTYECRDCHEKFETISKLHKHRYQAHFSVFKCPHCKTSHKNSSTLDKHIKNDHKEVPPVKCPICHKIYRCRASVFAHVRTRHGAIKAGEEAYCAECGIQFTTVSSYRSHLKNSLKHIALDDMKYECDSCGKRFSNKGSLRSHIEIHTDRKDFKCVQCGTAFKGVTYLRTHIRLKHGKRKRNHACHICPKAYYNKHTLEQHLNVHQNYRPFVCEICSADFSHAGSLYTHKKLKHGIKKKRE